jgi:hypothetical protein
MTGFTRKFAALLAVVFDSCDVDGIGVSGDGRIFARIL